MSKKEQPDPRLHPAEIPAPLKNGRPMVAGEASEDPIDVVAARYQLTRIQAEEIFAYFDETMNSGDTMMATSSLSQGIAEAVRERDKQWFFWLGKIFTELDFYTAKQRGFHFVRMALITMGYVTGFGELLGVKSFPDIARRELKMLRKQSGKQTVNKCGWHFLEQLKLAPMLTQRTEAARQEMAAARNEQLTKKP